MIKECKTAVASYIRSTFSLPWWCLCMSYYNRHIPEKQHLQGLNYHLGGLGQGPNSQGNWKIIWYYLFWQILQVKMKKILFLGLSNSRWCQHLDSFKVVLSNTEYIGKDGSSMSEKSMRSLNCAIRKKNSWQLCQQRRFLMH